MKQLFTVVGFVGLAAMVLPTCAPAPEPLQESAPEPVFDQAAEEAAVRQFEEQLVSAYNNYDSAAFLSFYADDFENWTGTLKGRASLEEGAAKFFERQRELKATLLEDMGIIFVTPDVAIAKARYEETGRLGEDGQALPPYRYLEADVLVKRDGRWQRVAMFQRPIEE
jgi:uncharacterized protein (TIGR02246 family)